MQILTFVLAMTLCLSAGPGRSLIRAQQADPITVIEMTAEKYEYKPAEIRVKTGTRVQLKVRALDRDHGLKFKLYPEGEDKEGPVGLRFEEGRNEVRLEEGQVVTVEFVAERPGRYEFECSVFCGLRHHGMDAWLIVER